ncbi:MAG TPA: hypothetical protein VJ161_05690 [Geobacteraceae bacterium]|nr:hypothetical protein [Geobacteraceae bacterium]
MNSRIYFIIHASCMIGEPFVERPHISQEPGIHDSFIGSPYLGKSVYPAASKEYQTFISACGFKGQPLENRSTRSGLLMIGRPKEIISAWRL